jgi:ABC-type antimicrobial peptide transport system permease subunit
VIREQRAGTVVAGLASLVSLAGCATLMTLVLVHYERRRRELAVRIALGASQPRLAAELSGELAWLATGGTGCAVLVAVWSLRALPALALPGGVDLGRLDLSLDWRVGAAALSTTVLSLMSAAFVPVSRFTRASLAGELIGAGSTTPPSSQRHRQTLLGLHVCATIVVLVAAGLSVRAVLYGFSAGPGFDVDRTVYVQVQVVPPFVSSDKDDEARMAVIAPRLLISSGRDIVRRDLGRQRLAAWFFSGFGLVALVLGAGGVFGLVAYLAESRRREFGVRLALGATPRDLVWRGVVAGLVPVSIGTAAGLVLAALVSRVFVALLPGLSAFAPLTYASVAALMIGCAAAAGVAGAWRLRRTAPADALRAE